MLGCIIGKHADLWCLTASSANVQIFDAWLHQQQMCRSLMMYPLGGCWGGRERGPVWGRNPAGNCELRCEAVMFADRLQHHCLESVVLKVPDLGVKSVCDPVLDPRLNWDAANACRVFSLISLLVRWFGCSQTDSPMHVLQNGIFGLINVFTSVMCAVAQHKTLKFCCKLCHVHEIKFCLFCCC